MNILNSNAALETNVYYGGAQIARVTDTDLWMLMRTNEYGEPIEIMLSGYNSESPVPLLNFDALDPWEDVDMTPDGTGALPDAVDTVDTADAVDVDDDEVVVELSFTADDSTTEDSIGTASDDA